jgi:hypothetical protein
LASTEPSPILRAARRVTVTLVCPRIGGMGSDQAPEYAAMQSRAGLRMTIVTHFGRTITQESWVAKIVVK